MNEFEATEQAYKNGYKDGYEAGVKDLAERVKNAPSVTNCENEWLCLDIDTITKELLVNYESSKNDKQRKEDEGKCQKYICVAKCPELDYDNSRHCVTENPKHPFSFRDYDCPCGNYPKWKEIQDSPIEKGGVE